MVDPLVSSVQAGMLVEGHDLDAGYAEGGRALHVERPFPVTVTPQDLLDRQPPARRLPGGCHACTLAHEPAQKPAVAGGL